MNLSPRNPTRRRRRPTKLVVRVVILIICCEYDRIEGDRIKHTADELVSAVSAMLIRAGGGRRGIAHRTCNPGARSEAIALVGGIYGWHSQGSRAGHDLP